MTRKRGCVTRKPGRNVLTSKRVTAPLDPPMIILDKGGHKNEFRVGGDRLPETKGEIQKKKMGIA